MQLKDRRVMVVPSVACLMVGFQFLPHRVMILTIIQDSTIDDPAEAG